MSEGYGLSSTFPANSTSPMVDALDFDEHAIVARAALTANMSEWDRLEIYRLARISWDKSISKSAVTAEADRLAHAVGRQMDWAATAMSPKDRRQLASTGTPTPGMMIRAARDYASGIGDGNCRPTGRTADERGHEMIRALRQDGLFKSTEWEALERAVFSQDWLGRFRIVERHPHLTDQAQIEEAVAAAFGEWRHDRNAAIVAPFIKALFIRIASALPAHHDLR